MATVAINGGKNAGLLAVKMLAMSDQTLLNKLKEYSAQQCEQVKEKDRKLQETGWRDYRK